MRLNLLNPQFQGNARPIQREAMSLTDEDSKLVDAVFGPPGSLRRMIRGAGPISSEQAEEVRQYLDDTPIWIHLPETPEQLDLDSERKYQILHEATLESVAIHLLAFRNPSIEEYGLGFLVRFSVKDISDLPTRDEIDELIGTDDGIQELASRIDTTLSLTDFELCITDEFDDFIFETGADGDCKEIELNQGKYRIYIPKD